MRFTVKTKIIAGLAVITLIGIATMLLVYRGLKEVESDVHELAQVQEPRILAAYEMEINMKGIGLEVLKYLSTRNESYRRWAEQDISDFDGFHAQYRELIASDEERALEAKISELYLKFVGLARNLMQYADKQEALFTQVASRIEEIDNLIQNEVQPVIASVKELTESKLNKAMASANLESELAEIGFWTANYQRLQTPEAKAEIDKKIGYFEKVLADFESYDLTSKERQIAQTVREIFGEIKTGIGEVVALEDAMSTARERFIDLRS